MHKNDSAAIKMLCFTSFDHVCSEDECFQTPRTRDEFYEKLKFFDSEINDVETVIKLTGGSDSGYDHQMLTKLRRQKGKYIKRFRNLFKCASNCEGELSLT